MAHRSWTSITSQSSCHNSLEPGFTFTGQQNTHKHRWHSLATWKYASNNFVGCTGPVLLCCPSFKELLWEAWISSLPLQWGITGFSTVMTLKGNLVILGWRRVCAQSHRVRWIYMDLSVKWRYLTYLRVLRIFPGSVFLQDKPTPQKRCPGTIWTLAWVRNHSIQVIHNKKNSYGGVVFVSHIHMNSYLPKESSCHWDVPGCSAGLLSAAMERLRSRLRAMAASSVQALQMPLGCSKSKKSPHSANEIKA